ncbi:hypothetical protein LCGC14_1337410 [marine sediment metagenome]|uniref:Uncharacterized protein n=1 Tax=marine sediment metagenome TaxID=412755 RepID=A0A0F9L114_9ZZZZ
MTVRIRDEDRGFKRIIRAMLQADDAEVSIGVQEPEGDQDRGGITMAGIATVHEFGAPSVNIPERSFIRSTVDENRQKYARLFDRSGLAAARGKQAVGKLFVAGEIVRADIVKKIRKGISPPLKNPGNKRDSKGKFLKQRRPLIDTGILLGSITTKVTGR